jgi:hypothetical protein
MQKTIRIARPPDEKEIAIIDKIVNDQKDRQWSDIRAFGV